MSITKHLDREINILGAEAQALRGHGQEEEAKVLFNVCDRLRAVSIRIETQACEERIERYKRMQAKLDAIAKEEAFA